MTTTQAMLAGIVVFLLCTWCIRTLNRLTPRDRPRTLVNVLLPRHDPGFVGRGYRIYLLTFAVVTQLAMVVATLRPGTEAAAWLITVVEIALAGWTSLRIWMAPRAGEPPGSA